MQNININVNFENVIGRIKPMHAVNNMPTVPYDEEGWDERMRAAHIPYGRLHDTGWPLSRYVDIPNVFPNFDADENDPENYDFAFTDVLLKRMIDCGVEPYYRLGVTIENYVDIKAYRIYPPKDNAKWARICEHVIMHYNEGWADGFHYNIKYWEIWNEPDNDPDPLKNRMWRGTMEEYFELYRVASKHLKARFPHLKIGGYSSCGFYRFLKIDNKISEAHSTWQYQYLIEFFERFLEYIKEHDCPLDFFGWHVYGVFQDNIYEFARYPREKLDAYGYTETEIHLNEWNPSTRQRGKLKDASNILGLMISLQDTPTDMCCYYNFSWMSRYCGVVNPLDKSPFKAYYTFYNFGQLYALEGQAECRVDGSGVYALAATNGQDGGIAVANCSKDDAVLNVSALGLLGKKARFYITDELHDRDEVEAKLDSLLIPKDAILYIEY